MRMRLRTVIGGISGVIALVLAFAPMASAQSVTQSIWCSLFNGSNFSFSTACPAQPSPPPAPGGNGQYVALGDSVAAGFGLPLDTNATTEDQLCRRSPDGYPNLVASHEGLTLTNATCSGATAGDLFTPQVIGETVLPAQLDAAFQNGTPQLMTITAGANDLNWASVVQLCYTTRCDDSATLNATLSAYRAALRVKLNLDLFSIYRRSGGNPPQVYLTGYYFPFSSQCASSSLTASEISWLGTQQRLLNNAIRSVSSHYQFAHFVPIDFTGHDLCSGDSWVQGPTDPAPFHPTVAGQQAIATSIEQAIDQ